jgi:uncharacterized membrane protein YraQ (UPF0718 family)
MIEMVLSGAVLRVFQALLQAFPTIIVGLLVAGVFRRLLGYSATRRLFGGTSWRAIPQAWALGMLLPVCSLGVIPVIREMRRAGVSGGAILAFALTAPLFNPISILYGLTLADPIVIFAFSACSLLVVTVVGVAWDRLYPGTDRATPELPPVAVGYKRMIAVAVAGLREMGGGSIAPIAIGLAGVALLAAVLPHGMLQSSAEGGDPWAPLMMTIVAIPAYATPITAMSQVASMFQHGNSVGAAFSLLVFGAGANLGIVAWMASNYGWRRTSVWFTILVAIVVALAYGVDRPLHPRGAEPAGHTHAFDGYCCPYQESTRSPAKATMETIFGKTLRHEWLGLGTLALLALAGLCLNRFDATGRIEAWLEQSPEEKLKYDLVLPPAALGAISLVGLVAFSVFGCFLYYPPVEEILADLQAVNAEVVTAANSQNWEHALLWIPFYDDWTRKLQVSVVLRGGKISEYQRMRARILRDKLEILEHEVEDQEVEESQKIAIEVQRSYRRLVAAYRK